MGADNKSSSMLHFGEIEIFITQDMTIHIALQKVLALVLPGALYPYA